MIKNKPHDYKIDVWSLGILLYELLHGFPPFKGKTNDEKFAKILSGDIQFHDISTDAQDLIRSFLKDDPNLRPTFDYIFNHSWIKNFEKKFKISVSDYVYNPKRKIKKKSSEQNKEDSNIIISSTTNSNNIPPITQISSPLITTTKKITTIINPNLINNSSIVNFSPISENLQISHSPSRGGLPQNLSSAPELKSPMTTMLDKNQYISQDSRDASPLNIVRDIKSSLASPIKGLQGNYLSTSRDPWPNTQLYTATNLSPISSGQVYQPISQLIPNQITTVINPSYNLSSINQPSTLNQFNNFSGIPSTTNSLNPNLIPYSNGPTASHQYEIRQGNQQVTLTNNIIPTSPNQTSGLERQAQSNVLTIVRNSRKRSTSKNSPQVRDVSHSQEKFVSRNTKNDSLFEKESGLQLTASPEKLKLETQEILYANTSSTDISINSSISNSRVEKANAPSKNPIYHIGENNDQIIINSNPTNNSSNWNQNHVIKVQEPIQSTNYIATEVTQESNQPNYVTKSKEYGQGINHSANTNTAIPQKISSSYKISNQNVQIKINPSDVSSNSHQLSQNQSSSSNINYNSNSNFSASNSGKMPIKDDFMTPGDPLAKKFLENLQSKVISSPDTRNSNISEAIVTQIFQNNDDRTTRQNDRVTSILQGKNASEVDSIMDKMFNGDSRFSKSPEPIRLRELSLNSPSKDPKANNNSTNWTPIKNDPSQSKNPELLDDITERSHKDVSDNENSVRIKFKNPNSNSNYGYNTPSSPVNKIVGGESTSTNQRPTNLDKYLNSDSEEMEVLNRLIALQSGQKYVSRSDKVSVQTTNDVIKIGEIKENTHNDNYANSGKISNERTTPFKAHENQFKFPGEKQKNDASPSTPQKVEVIKKEDLTKNEITKSSQDLIPKNYQIETNLSTNFQASQLLQVIPDLNHKKLSTAVNNQKIPPPQRTRIQSDNNINEGKERSRTPEITKSQQEQIEQSPELNKNIMKKKDTPDFQEAKEPLVTTNRAVASRSEENKKSSASVLINAAASIQMDKQEYEKEYDNNLGNVRPFSFGEKGLKKSKLESSNQSSEIIKEKTINTEEINENHPQSHYQNHNQSHYLESKRQVTPEKVSNNANKLISDNKFSVPTSNQSQMNEKDNRNEHLKNNSNPAFNRPQYRQPDYNAILKKDIPPQSTNKKEVLPQNDPKIQNYACEEDAYRPESVVIIPEKYVKHIKPSSEKHNQHQNLKQLLVPLQSFNQNNIVDDMDKSNSTVGIDDTNFEFSFDQKVMKKKGKNKLNESNVNSITEENEEILGFQSINIKGNSNRVQSSLPIKVSTKDNVIEVNSRGNPIQNFKPNNSKSAFEVQQNQVTNDYKKHSQKVEDSMFSTDNSSKINEIGALSNSGAYAGPKKFHNHLVQQKNLNENAHQRKYSDNTSGTKPDNKNLQRRALDKSLFETLGKPEEFGNNKTANNE